jgi:hypothetical protein
MKIIKFIEFIKEDITETPSNMTSTALTQLKKRIDKIFAFQENEFSDEEPSDEMKPKKIKKKKSKEKMTFKDLGVRLESSEVSKYSKLHDSLTIKFSDDENTYTLIISMDIKEGLPKQESKAMMCDIKFKKYDLDTFEIIGQIPSPIDGDKSEYLKVEIDKIDEEYLIDLKIKLDESTSDEEEFEIETQ